MADDGNILGMDSDYNTLDKANRDGFELHLNNIIKMAFGSAFVASSIKASFPKIDEVEICRIDIKPGTKELFLEETDKHGKKDKKFYVRTGNSSTPIEIDQVSAYIKDRFS